MKRRISALILVLAFIISTSAFGEEKAFFIDSIGCPVPNPENAWESMGAEARFELISQGEMDAGSLKGAAYIIRYVGQDEELKKKFEESPYEVIHTQYVEMKKKLGIETQNATVTVNGTEAMLYTYPNGGRVLYAGNLPGMEPLMLVEDGYGLTIEKAVEKEDDFVIVLSTPSPTEEPAPTATSTPKPTPTQKPKAYPPRFNKSGSIGFMGETMVTYQYSGTSSDVADYIATLVDAGYSMKEREFDDYSITMIFRNDEEDIELEVYQLLSDFGDSTIMITYFWICPDGEIINGKIVKK